MYLLERSIGRFMRAWKYYIVIIMELAAGMAVVACQDSVALAVEDRLACYERQFLEDGVSILCSSLTSSYGDRVEPKIAYEDYQFFLEEMPEETELFYIQYGSVDVGLNSIPVLAMSENEFERLTGYPMKGNVWIGGEILRMLQENSGDFGGRSCLVQGESLYLCGSSFLYQELRKDTLNRKIINFNSGVKSDILAERCIFLPIGYVQQIDGPLFGQATLEVAGDGYLRKANWMAEYLSQKYRQYYYEVVNRRMVYLNNSGDLSSTVKLLGWIGRFALLLATVGIVGIMLIHLDERKKDFAVSMTVGATKGRLMAETVIEILFLCLSGGIIAVGISAVVSPMLSTSRYLVEFNGHSAFLAMASAFGIAAIVCGTIAVCAKIKEPAAALKEAK